MTEQWFFFTRHVSVLRALLALGMADADARQLIEQTRRAGGTDYRLSHNGASFLVRQMKGYHADVFRLEEA